MNRRPAVRNPWWPIAVVAGTALVGLVVAVAGPWRIGGSILGGSLLLGALIRLVLPARGAGLLQVRSKGFDVLVMLLGGAAIVALSIVVPNR